MNEPRTRPAAHLVPPENEASPLDDVASPAPSFPFPSDGPLVAECIDARHPTLLGRVLCRMTSTDGAAVERWIPTLMHLAVREGDRVLLLRPSNFAEPVVVGVIDGFAPRPAPSASAAAVRSLAADETVRFENARGEPLVEIGPGPTGPLVRLLSSDVEVETPGALRVRAASIALQATQGEVRLEAEADVVVQGEAIHLN